MSLLLDALKKAAQEKQNASSAGNSTDATDELGLAGGQDSAPVQHSQPEDPDKLDTLDEFELDEDMLLPAGDAQAQPDVEQPKSADSNHHEHRVTPTPSTVTDEALRLLITKTNEKHKKSRLFTWGSVVAGALALLIIGGLYFYNNMIEEIESMQQKHQIALAALKSKTRIEENLTSLAVVPDSETGANQVTQKVRPPAKPDNKTVRKVTTAETSQQADKVFSVQRGEQRDPVSEALERGWLAYQREDYTLAKLEYEKALAAEPDNHDALLGMAAVSLQQQEVDAAREIYLKLLEQDPRDPHAHAGLANIAQISGSSLSETKLKQLIEYRPDDAHLQFALGSLYVQKKRWPEAQQAFFNAWKADSGNPDYTYNLAVSLDHLGKYREAKAYYENSLELANGKKINFSTDAVRNRLAYLGSSQ
jgi:tetratricopeptide (TPR) repeat protein